MHTPSSAPFSSPFLAWPNRRPVRLALLVLVTGLLFWPSPALGQADFPGAPDTTSVNFRAYLADFLGPRAGPGIGVGMVVHNLARDDDQWLVTAAPALHEQVATLSFASANPNRAHRYVLTDVRGLHTNRDWLAGRGERRPAIERSSVHGRIRVGQAFLDRQLLIQPHVTVSHHTIQNVSSPLPHPDGHASFRSSLRSPQTGMRPGLALQFDTRDQTLHTTRGLLVQGTWAQYVSLSAASVRFDQFALDAYGYVPLGGLHRVAIRGSGIITQSRGSDPVPIYMRPRLGGSQVPGLARGQFIGKHRLLGSALYRFPLKHILGFAAIEGHLGVHLANVYDDLDAQFSPSVSFEEDPPYEDARPLRPAASAGLRFLAPARERVTLEVALGVTPSGVSGVRFSFLQSLQALRPPHHTLSHLW
ncbi:hypothetical protein BSZ35_03135 [Salinibacter sp. 10B]|uniref:BamA/TamA family outer membrane protein n=1 Tax=Salinibacter sp. 10B TaxID=1923971 RepID=UPI000CF42560|nr:BamA/TamA family outer membrane protein [Salinibacter sp. 10B]PQJ33729.1 hypothetical protein BSZ35_03135 [Salinibacter sp. 10B]